MHKQRRHCNKCSRMPCTRCMVRRQSRPAHPLTQAYSGGWGRWGINGGRGLGVWAWGPRHLAHFRNPIVPRPTRGSWRPLWWPWGCCNTHTSQGSRGGFCFLVELLELQLLPDLPSLVRGGQAELQLITTSPPHPLHGSSCLLMSKPGWQAVCLCCQGCFRMGLYFGFCFSPC